MGNLYVYILYIFMRFETLKSLPKYRFCLSLCMYVYLYASNSIHIYLDWLYCRGNRMWHYNIIFFMVYLFFNIHLIKVNHFKMVYINSTMYL